MIVVYAGTRNLYRKMMPSIRSLLHHNDVERIYLLVEDATFPCALPECCRLVNVADQTYFPKGGPNSRSPFTYMAMMRACYAELFPRADRVIQLDVDTIVCDDLRPIWNLDMGEKWFAAAEEVNSNWKPFGPVYYNVGVTVFNLAQMRRDFAVRRLVRILNARECRYVDQDALNMFADAKGMPLPARYNETEFTGMSENPAIVHFAGYRDWWCNERMPRRGYLDMWRRDGDYGPDFA